MDNQFKDIYKYLLSESPPSLAELLQSKIDSLKLSNRQTSEIFGIQRTTLQRILDNEAQKIDIITFLKIRNFIDIDLEEFTRIYVSSMSADEIRDIERVRKAVVLFNNFDLKSLKESGFIKDVNDIDSIEKRITTFFGLTSIYEYESSVNVLLSSTENKYISNARTMWLKSVEGALRKINNPNKFNRELLIEMITRIPFYSRNETNGLLTVIRALFKVGLTVIYQPYPHNTQIRGASFVLGGNKPCIVLTDYNKRYDTIWWTLMHELYHILYDYDRLKKTIFHLSGEEDIFLSEEKANKFATESFLSEDKMQFITPLINSEEIVENQAKVWNIHPSLIYGFYMYKNKGSISKYRGRIPKSMIATKDININLMQSETLVESVEKLVSKVFNL